jgi:molecular chaperone DnaK (HSP70)
MASDNVSLGQFNHGIPGAKVFRQIEVTFDIDANRHPKRNR